VISLSVPKLVDLNQGPVLSYYKHWIWNFNLLDTEIPNDIKESNNFGSANTTRKNWNDHQHRSFLKKESEWVEEYTKSIHSLFVNLIDGFDGDLQKSFTNNWPWIIPGNIGGATSFTNIVCDQNGHKMSKHLDNRRTVFAAILNLTENKEGTKFWDYKDPNKLIYSCPGTKGHGVIFMNTAGSLHDINVEQDTPRLTAQTQLSLYIK
jgi:hypothetical protein